MTGRDDDDLHLRPGPPRAKGGSMERPFVSRVIKATSQAGGARTSSRSTRLASQRKAFGRGAVFARLHAGKLDVRSRRVTIKVRLVNLRTASAKSTSLHLRYIHRDGVDRQGEPGQAYGPTSDQVDTKRFEVSGREDRHQFRLIVSPEDAAEIGDLKPFTRDLMARIEKDLGTRLDWVAVDHWDTDNPHTHIVLRGKDQNGYDLIIAREYIAHGMRVRASALATEWLGPRTEREIQESLSREVEQERWTSIDHSLQREMQTGVIDVRQVSTRPEARFERSLRIGRLQRLQQMGLAQQSDTGVWKLNSQAEPVLRAMGERGDIIRTMQRALSGRPRELVMDDRKSDADVIGRIIGKGLADELHDRGYLVVDGLDGRAHYIGLSAHTKLSDFTEGAIVRVCNQSRADHTIASVAEQGIYRTERHLALVSSQATTSPDPESYVGAHVRRLEALRRASIVERIEEGVWRIPADLVDLGRSYDARRRESVSVDVLSLLPLSQQVRAIGATWLDHQLIGDMNRIPETGFGVDVRQALRQRLTFLTDEGLASRQGTKLILTSGLLATLRTRELDRVAKKISTESRLVYRPAKNGQPVSGIYRRSLMLASGRFAMLDDGVGFSLVPWRPVIDRHLGRPVQGVLNGSGVSWDFSKSRGLGR